MRLRYAGTTGKGSFAPYCDRNDGYEDLPNGILAGTTGASKHSSPLSPAPRWGLRENEAYGLALRHVEAVCSHPGVGTGPGLLPEGCPCAVRPVHGDCPRTAYKRCHAQVLSRFGYGPDGERTPRGLCRSPWSLLRAARRTQLASGDHPGLDPYERRVRYRYPRARAGL